MSAASVRPAPAPHAAQALAHSASAARGPLGARPGAGAGTGAGAGAAGSFESVLQGTLAGPRTPAPGSASAAAAAAPTTGRAPAPTSTPTSEPTSAPTSDSTDRTADQSDTPVAPAPGTGQQQPGILLPPPGFSLPVLPSGAETGAELGADTGDADGETVEPGAADSAAAGPTPATAVPAGALTAPISAPPASVAAGAAAPAPAAPAAPAAPVAGTAAAGLAAVRTSVAGEPVATVAPADASAPTALLVPLGTPAAAATPAAAPIVPPGAPAPAAPPAPLAGQVSRPLFTLVGAANGDHVMTISVSPDNLGPVTVQAHVRGEHIRVELFAPTDLARDALRAILPDLRRDLSGGGLNAQLTLSADARASDPSGSRQGAPDGRQGRAAGDSALPADPAGDPRADLRPPSVRAAGSNTIDVLA